MTNRESLPKVNEQPKEEVLGDEVIFKLVSDSSAWPQNDNMSGTT